MRSESRWYFKNIDEPCAERRTLGQSTSAVAALDEEEVEFLQITGREAAKLFIQPRHLPLGSPGEDGELLGSDQLKGSFFIAFSESCPITQVNPVAERGIVHQVRDHFL